MQASTENTHRLRVNRVLATLPYLGQPKALQAVQTNRSSVFIYHRSNNNSTTSAVLRYDPFSKVTIGYVLLGPDIEIDDVSNAVKSEFPLFGHPLLIPTLLIELTAFNLMGKLTSVHRDLASIEKETGFGDWDRPARKGEDSTLTYRKLARDLGALNSRYAFIDVAIRCTGMATDFTMREIVTMKLNLPAANLRPLDNVIPSLIDRINVTSSGLKHMEAFGGISQRINAQQNVVSLHISLFLPLSPDR